MPTHLFVLPAHITLVLLAHTCLARDYVSLLLSEVGPCDYFSPIRCEHGDAIASRVRWLRRGLLSHLCSSVYRPECLCLT